MCVVCFHILTLLPTADFLTSPTPSEQSKNLLQSELTASRTIHSERERRRRHKSLAVTQFTGPRSEEVSHLLKEEQREEEAIVTRTDTVTFISLSAFGNPCGKCSPTTHKASWLLSVTITIFSWWSQRSFKCSVK